MQKNIYLAKNLKYLRNIKGISLAKLGTYFDKTDVAMYKWENGLAEPNALDLFTLSVLYDIDIDTLIKVDLTSVPKEELINYSILCDLNSLDPKNRKIVENLINQLLREVWSCSS